MATRVLFIDDDSFILRAISRNLNHRLDITTASCAEDAMTLLNGPGAFDVAVTDIHMPGIGGVEFIKWAAEAVPKMRLIVMSGAADAEVRRFAESVPAVYRVLSKPVDLSALLEEIEAAASHHVSAV